MPIKRRNPKVREAPISARAIDLFVELQRHHRDSDYWYEIHEELHSELQARPWEYPLDSKNGTHIWEALLEAAQARQARSAPAPTPPTSKPDALAELTRLAESVGGGSWRS